MEKIKLFFKAMFSLSRTTTPAVYRYAAVIFMDVVAMLWFILSDIPRGTPHFIVCIFKNLTGYPCPACGTTRGLKFFFHLMPCEAFMMNPIAVLVGIAMVVVLVWSVRDLVVGRPSMFNVARKKIPWYLIVLIVIFLIFNEIWNINKGV
ncbi:MAG: DUF2752 domain-containing protein [Bacteroidales bacterium]|nr:DUF2752 domain-containing protein [Bacteroidales bacterium]